MLGKVWSGWRTPAWLGEGQLDLAVMVSFLELRTATHPRIPRLIQKPRKHTLTQNLGVNICSSHDIIYIKLERTDMHFMWGKNQQTYYSYAIKLYPEIQWVAVDIQHKREGYKYVLVSGRKLVSGSMPHVILFLWWSAKGKSMTVRTDQWFP